MTRFETVGPAELATGLVLLGAAVTVVAALLPWISVQGTVFSETLTGIDGEGLVTIALAATAAVLALFHDWKAVTAAGVVGIGMLVALVGIAYILDPLAAVDVDAIDGGLSTDNASAEIGLYLTALGGLGLIGGGLAGFVTRSEAGSDSAAGPPEPEE